MSYQAYIKLVRLPSFELGFPPYEDGAISNTAQDAYNDLLSNLISSIAFNFSSLSLVPTRRYSMRHAMCFSVVIICLVSQSILVGCSCEVLHLEQPILFVS